MKITVISHSSVVAAYRGKLFELARFPGIELDLVIPPFWKEGGHFIAADIVRTYPYRIFVLPAFRLNYGASYFYNPFKLKKLLKTAAPDIIYIEEEPWSVASWQALRIGRKIKSKVVFFTWENIFKKYKWISEIILGYALKRSSGAVCGNLDAKNILERRGFSKPIIVLPQYGIDTEKIVINQKSLYGLDKLQKPLIGYAGRLEHEKGIDILLKAAAGIHADFSILIAGTGSAQEELRDLACRLNIMNRVRFLSGFTHDEVPSFFRHLDILVLPSRTTKTWREQFGRVLVEAMTQGVAVIGSDSGAIPEVIGDAGLIFAEEDTESLKSALVKLIESDQTRKMFSEKGKQRVKLFYSNTRVAKNLFNYFSELNK